MAPHRSARLFMQVASVHYFASHLSVTALIVGSSNLVICFLTFEPLPVAIAVVVAATAVVAIVIVVVLVVSSPNRIVLSWLNLDALDVRFRMQRASSFHANEVILDWNVGRQVKSTLRDLYKFLSLVLQFSLLLLHASSFC